MPNSVKLAAHDGPDMFSGVWMLAPLIRGAIAVEILHRKWIEP